MMVHVPKPRMRCEGCHELVERWFFTGDRRRVCAGCIRQAVRLADIARR